MPAAKSRQSLEPTCLFPGEDEIARLVVGPERAKIWPSLAIVLERRGLPKIDVQFGGRYWPKVRAFLDRHQMMDQDVRIPVEHKGLQGVDMTGGVRPRSRS